MSDKGSDDDIFLQVKKKSKKGKRVKKEKALENNGFADSDKNLKKLGDELIGIDKKLTNTNNADNTDNKRSELIKAAEDGYIDKKVEYLKKCGVKVIDKIYAAYIERRKKDADIFLTDLLISQFCSILGGLDAIEDPKELTDELKENTRMKKDIERAISFISPYIPLVGILSGIAVTGKHIYRHKITESADPTGPVGNN